MARGWESKSVEEQIDLAESGRTAAPATKLSPEDQAKLRKREGLLLSRTRVLHDIEAAQNPRYQAVLTKALAELDAQIAQL
jgi:hypothetical protein